jgi:hypothetical protein
LTKRGAPACKIMSASSLPRLGSETCTSMSISRLRRTISKVAWVHFGYAVSRQVYEARERQFYNLEVEIAGTEKPDEVVILGAHYDTDRKSPGANDNGSAIAALLELARAYAGKKFSRTLRIVAFTNEESPFTRTSSTGSRIYARRCRERQENIVAMVCLETIGFSSEEKGSQRMSFMGLLLPTRGNFIALVGNSDSKNLLGMSWTSCSAKNRRCQVKH